MQEINDQDVTGGGEEDGAKGDCSGCSSSESERSVEANGQTIEANLRLPLREGPVGVRIGRPRA